GGSPRKREILDQLGLVMVICYGSNTRDGRRHVRREREQREVWDEVDPSASPWHARSRCRRGGVVRVRPAYVRSRPHPPARRPPAAPAGGPPPAPPPGPPRGPPPGGARRRPAAVAVRSR